MKHLLPILLLTLLAACGPRQGEVVISGRFDNLNQADFLVYALDDGRAVIDTIFVRSGRFEYVAPLTGQATYHIIYPNYTELVVFASEGDEIEVTGAADNLRSVKVAGNADNEAYTRLRHQLNGISGEAQRDSVMRAYIGFHPDSRVSLHLQRVLQARCESPLHVGDTIPPFVFRTDSTSYVVTADSLRGHPTLIVLWASWLDGDHLSSVREALHDNDSLHAYTLSMDIDYSDHRRTIRQDSAFDKKYAARWHASHNRTGIGDSLLAAWRIIDLPCYIRVDTAGVITEIKNRE